MANEIFFYLMLSAGLFSLFVMAIIIKMRMNSNFNLVAYIGLIVMLVFSTSYISYELGFSENVRTATFEAFEKYCDKNKSECDFDCWQKSINNAKDINSMGLAIRQ